MSINALKTIDRKAAEEIEKKFYQSSFSEIAQVCAQFDFNTTCLLDRQVIVMLAISLDMIGRTDTAKRAFKAAVTNIQSEDEKGLLENYLSFCAKHKLPTAEVERSINELVAKIGNPNFVIYSYCGYLTKQSQGATTALKLLDLYEDQSASAWSTERIRALLRLNAYQHALTEFQRGFEMFKADPEFAEIGLNATIHSDDPENIESFASDLLKIHSNNFQIMETVAWVFSSLGMVDESNVLRINIFKNDADLPRRTRSLYNAVNDDIDIEIDIDSVISYYVQNFEKLLKRDQASISFVLSSLYRRQGDLERYIKYLRQGNRLKYELSGKDIEYYQAQVNRASSTYSAIKAREAEFFRYSGPVVFIVGLPRCGSTVISDWILRHYRSVNVEESGVLNQILTNFHGCVVNNFDASEVDKFIKNFANVWLHLLPRIPDSFDREHDLIIDKSLFNFFHVPAINSLFPNSKVIWLRKDRREHAWSMYKQPFKEDYHGYTKDFTLLKAMMDLESSLHDKYKKEGFSFESIYLDDVLADNSLLEGIIRPIQGAEKRSTVFSTTEKRVSLTASKHQIRQKFEKRQSELDAILPLLPELANF